MGQPYNYVDAVQARLLVSPNNYIAGPWGSVSHPAHPIVGGDERDFFVANGSSFRPTEWMLARHAPFIANTYWVLTISHRSFWDLILREQINPLLDSPPCPFRDVWRTFWSEPEYFSFYAGIISSLCPVILSPADGFDSHCIHHHSTDMHHFLANFHFEYLFNRTPTNQIECQVTMYGDPDCPGESPVTPEGGPLATPTLSTQVTNATVGINTPFRDTITLGGGNRPTGTITVTLYLNGAPISQETIPISGNGTYASGLIQAAVGSVYSYSAYYSGDARNNPVTMGYGDPHEQTTVVQHDQIGYKDVQLRMHVQPLCYEDVGLRANVSPVHPGIGHYQPSDGSRIKYKRTHP